MPDPVRPSLAALVFLALPLCLAPGLLWGEAFWLRDAWMMAWPLRDRCAAALAECRLPLWTSDAGAGAPLLANPSTGAAYPLNALLPWLPTGVGLAWLAAVHLAVAGLGARWLAREHGASRAASWVAGVAYALSGPAVSHLSTVQHGTAMAWMPVALAAGRRALHGQGGGWIALAAGAIALQVLGGEAQLAAYTGLALALSWALDAPRGGRARALGPLAAIAGLAVLCAAVQALPTLEWLGQVGQPRSGGGFVVGRAQDWGVIQESSWWPGALAEALLVPGTLGSPTERWWGFHGGVAARYTWLGFAGLSTLWLATQQPRGPGWRGPVAWVVLGAWLALGSFGGLYWVSFHAIPGFASFRFPDKALPLLSLGLAVLAALGVDRWTREDGRMGSARDQACWAAAVLVATLALVVVLTGPWPFLPGFGDARLPVTDVPWRAPALRAVVLAALAAGVLTATRPGRWLGGARAPLVLAALVAVECWWVNRAVAATRPAADLTAPAPAAAVFGPAPTTQWRCNGAWTRGEPDARATRDDVVGWNWRARRHWRMYGPLLEGRATLENYETSPLLGYLELVTGTGNPRLLGALAMRDVVAEPALGQREFALLATLEDGLRCYRNRAALPRVRLVGGVEAMADMATLRRRLDAPDFDHAARVCVLPADMVAHGPALASLDPAGAVASRAAIVRDAGAEVAIATTAPGPTLCVLADWDYPGWGAVIDGTPAPIIQAHGRLRAVMVPGGEHRVTFTLRSASATWGLALTLAGLVACLALFAVDRVGRR